MKKIRTAFILVTIAAMGMLTAEAAKKNDPDKKEVLKLMEEIGDVHFEERMKVNDLCSLKFEDASGEDSFYHIYVGTLKKGGYHVIVYNNVPEYLGFYKVEYEPSDYEEGTILLDSGDSDEDGNTSYFNLPIPDNFKGATVRIDGVPTKFVKNPQLEEKAAGSALAKTGGIPVVPKETSASGEVIDYRDWKITMNGKEITVNAIFVKVDKGKVTIKNSKNGREAQIPGSALSDEDKEYVRRITAK